MASPASPAQPPLGKHLWPAFGKPRVPGDILFWPRDDQRVLGISIKFTHWAVYVGRRKLAPCKTRWMHNVCESTGETLPEAVVHLWGEADSATRDTSSDAVVVLTPLSDLGGVAYDGNLEYDHGHTPRRPPQILHRVLVSLGSKKLYENRFGKYHVVGNNCEHFSTWARYGINRSDQIGDAVKLMGVLGGSVLVGAPGALLGGYAANAWIKRTYKSRQQEGFLLDRGHFCGTEACEGCASEGCAFCDAEKESDWALECSVRWVEDCDAKKLAEAAAYATGRAHLPRGAMGKQADDTADDSWQSTSHYQSTSHRTGISVGGYALHADAKNDEASRRLRRGGNENAPPDAAREVFSFDSFGNAGGLFGDAMKAFGEGLLGASCDANKGEDKSNSETGIGECFGKRGTGTDRASDDTGEDLSTGGTGEDTSTGGAGTGGCGAIPAMGKQSDASRARTQARPVARDGDASDDSITLKHAVTCGFSLFGAVLGGIAKVGVSVVSQIAEQHAAHRDGADDAISNAANTSNAEKENRPRRGPMVIQEVGDS